MDIRQTHESVVALAGAYAYKIRKPVDLGFLDFTTLDKRRQDCMAEARLNRRLAPGVYLGAFPLSLSGGELEVGGEGEAVEYAVKMMRLPEEATLRRHLARGDLTTAVMAELARRIAAFHAAEEPWWL